MGADVSVHLQETFIGHTDGHFLNVLNENHVPVCANFPGTISFATDPESGQAVLSVSTRRRDEASFNTYEGHPSIGPWRAEWGPIPVGVKRIFHAVE